MLYAQLYRQLTLRVRSTRSKRYMLSMEFPMTAADKSGR